MDESNAFLCIVIPVLILGVIWYGRYQKGKRIERARKDYQSSLNSLKRSPTNVNIRQNTLMRGREYARLLRDNKKETIFDEVALMNDINAIGGGHVVSNTTFKKQEEKSVEERLRLLEDLKNKNLISAEEYEQRKNSILSQI